MRETESRIEDGSESTPKFGVLLPSRVEAGEAACMGNTLDLAEQAEALGFDSLWAGESILARPRTALLPLLSAVAIRTSRVRIGSAVMLPALRSPLLLAHDLASLDGLSEGRLVVGVGLGIDNAETRREFSAAGVPFDERVGRTVAAVRAWRPLWRGDADHDDLRSRYFDLRGERLAPLPVQCGGPPVWIGSTLNLEPSLARVGRSFDGWMPTAPSAAAYASGATRVDAAASAAGRSGAVGRAVYLTVRVDDDTDSARRELAQFVQAYYGLPFSVMEKVQGMCAGSAATVSQWLASFSDAGVQHFILRIAGSDVSRQLTLLADGVLPGLRR